MERQHGLAHAIPELPGLVTELLVWLPDVVVVSGTPAALAVRQANGAIVIVFAGVADPAVLGFANNLSKRGDRSTGLTSQSTELTAKRVDLLRQFVPRLRRAAMLYHREDVSNVATARRVMIEAPTLGIDFTAHAFANADEVAQVLQKAQQDGADALLISAGVSVSLYPVIAKLALELRLPTLASERSFPAQGGLSSYATDFAEQLRRAAFYVDQILKGILPENLPIEQPTKFEFIVNMRTARALDLDISPHLLARADEVIE